MAKLHADGLGTVEIARALGVNSGAVSYHKRRLGLPMQEQGRSIDWVPVQASIDGGMTCRDAGTLHGHSHVRMTNAVRSGSLRRPPRAQEMTIHEYADHWNGTRATPGFRSRMRRELIAQGVCPEVCAGCHLGDWRGQPIPLELDHIDGDSAHNLISNFRLLCPNCHSQTPTWRGRNVRRCAA